MKNKDYYADIIEEIGLENMGFDKGVPVPCDEMLCHKCDCGEHDCLKYTDKWLEAETGVYGEELLQKESFEGQFADLVKNHDKELIDKVITIIINEYEDQATMLANINRLV